MTDKLLVRDLYAKVKDAAKALAAATEEWQEKEPAAAPFAAICSGLAALILDPGTWQRHIDPVRAAVVAEAMEASAGITERARQEAN